MEQIALLKERHGLATVDAAIEKIALLQIEIPSWGFGRGGSRFASYPTGKEAADIKDKIEKAGEFARLTGKGKTVALHFPWDGSNRRDVQVIAKQLTWAGVNAGSINVNLFTPREDGPLNSNLRFGSLTHPSAEVRRASIEHMLECIEYMRMLKSNTLAFWLPDGSNSPGQMSFYDQAARLDTSLKTVCDSLRKSERMLIEYKLFEPGCYSTAIQDYARSAELCAMLGKRAAVLVDLGHHALTVNVEQIVAHLIMRDRLGGFHFNDHCYADDDLATGSVNPHQLFRIFCVMVEGEKRGYTPIDRIALMIDQSHCVKDPFMELVESLENILIAYAKSLLVDYNALKKAQDSCNPSRADRILNDAYHTDVRPLIAEWRKSQGLLPDPLSVIT